MPPCAERAASSLYTIIDMLYISWRNVYNGGWDKCPQRLICNLLEAGASVPARAVLFVKAIGGTV
jgi:hypothetical protein